MTSVWGFDGLEGGFGGKCVLGHEAVQAMLGYGSTQWTLRAVFVETDLLRRTGHARDAFLLW